MDYLSKDTLFAIYDFISFLDIKAFLLINKKTLSLLNYDIFYKYTLTKLYRLLEKSKHPKNIDFKKTETWKESFLNWNEFYKLYKSEGTFKSIFNAQKKTLKSSSKNTSKFIIYIFLEEHLHENGIVEFCAICRKHLTETCIECDAHLIDTQLVSLSCPLTVGTCNHVFHYHCMNRWLANREVCPLDNKNWDNDAKIIL